MPKHIKSLSARLGCPVVIVDIEHTGSKKDARGICEIACLVIDHESTRTGLDSLIKPAPHVTFNPVVMGITKISPRKVANAPSWQEAVGRFMHEHQNSLWVGFNSAGCDMPMIRAENRQAGLPCNLLYHLDVMKLAKRLGETGNLSGLVERLAPDALEPPHRAMADVRMTAALLNVLLEQASETIFAEFGLHRRKTTSVSDLRPSTTVITRPSGAEQQVIEGVEKSQAPKNHGKKWSQTEDDRLRKEWGESDKTLEMLAPLFGRTPGGLAYRLKDIGAEPDVDTVCSLNIQRGGDYGKGDKARIFATTVKKPETVSVDRPPELRNQGKPWTKEDIERLLTEWSDSSNTLDAIAPSYGRTPGGLASQLERQGVCKNTKEIRYENMLRGGDFGSEFKAGSMEGEGDEAIRRSATNTPVAPSQSPTTSVKKKSSRSIRENKGKPWTADDCARLLEAWADTNNTLGSLAKTFGRTAKALLSRLSKIGEMPTKAAIQAENRLRCKRKVTGDQRP